MARIHFASAFSIGDRVDFNFIHPKTKEMRAQVVRRNVSKDNLTVLAPDGKKYTISATLARKVRGRRPTR